MTSESDIQQGIHKALQANKDHQYALRIYSERIDAELESLNKLLAAADVSDTEEDTLELNTGGWVVIPDATDAIAPVSPVDLLHHASPFREAALRRQRYVDATVMHQWKPNDLEALSDAVRSENHRLYAVEAQLRGQQGLPRQTEDLTRFMEENTTGIDWERVSVKVSKSSLSGDHRSAKACEIKWLGERHPRFNHSQWMQPEIDRVKELVSGSGPGQVNWVYIAEKLGTGRTPLDCMRHAIYRRLHFWDADSDGRLRTAVETYGADNWPLAARLVSEDATPQQCQGRWTRYLDPNIRRGSFTEEEDRLLRDAVAVYGNAWHEISPFLSGRTNEQCRERAQEFNTIANVKKKWTEDEDRAILRAAEDAEVIDFAEVTRVLGTGRTEAQVRNRYSALMRRVNRIATHNPTATQMLRPILPASPLQPVLQPVAGPSKPAPQPSRPRPRPRRKRVVETNPAPLDESTSLAPPPGDDQGRDVEAAPPVARRKGKGKVIELPYEADEPEEDTPTQARKMPKRSRDTAADRPASRKKATKNKELLRANELAGDQTVGCASSRCNRDVVNVM
ncbi:hypothetical protein FOMPIDRAFT_1117324 [Fomitopsis schrenkii]|uniref:Uncharacterized protein n=1 Tax=Fomitopsis schrenkii TaxID=2126942 RepID=S8EHS5_FOMSC|nr:hypothetical protein FOMPIDRAFT_1117324 [Fomitopsis schrenkii]